MYQTYGVLIIVASVLHSSVEGKVSSDGEGGGSISFGQDYNDEFDHSDHMPDQLKCDACKAIAYQLSQRFEIAHKKRPSVTEFSESEVLDITEATCSHGWKGYGITHSDNIKRLSGEGLTNNNLPGVTQEGGKIPERLREMCLLYMGEHDEMTVYHMFKHGDGLEKYLCFGAFKPVRGYCGDEGDSERAGKSPKKKSDAKKQQELPMTDEERAEEIDKVSKVAKKKKTTNSENKTNDDEATVGGRARSINDDTLIYRKVFDKDEAEEEARTISKGKVGGKVLPKQDDTLIYPKVVDKDEAEEEARAAAKGKTGKKRAREEEEAPIKTEL